MGKEETSLSSGSLRFPKLQIFVEMFWTIYRAQNGAVLHQRGGRKIVQTSGT